MNFDGDGIDDYDELVAAFDGNNTLPVIIADDLSEGQVKALILMLDRLTGKGWYCFIDGYSSYNQISIAPKDQENTTFTCPYGTFAFKKMLFGLCNSLAIFQRCMMSIFSDMVEETIEVFMDDISLVSDLFDDCLAHLTEVLKQS
ncbi:RNA-directed DNA polymerase homolog [Solanum tuberosum]|uniref:RNA-directed DNA polymerase homolog n=1 Tax=Solanum tuberosum TaxID=4113 RepID=UPI00073A04B4|nr:PREDICTED: RNA-directed DNA polymerase homolog [Solanum tuberosum]